MFKRYLNISDERMLREQSMVTFKEVSSGVYHVDKDRVGIYPSYVKSEEVIEALNNKEKIAVTGNSGIYANFELVKYSR